MIPFQAPVEDILFSLEKVGGAERLPGWDSDLAQEILRQFGRLAEGEIAPVDEIADREGCRLDEARRVRMPEAMKRAYAAYAEQGWPGLGLPEAAGGQGAPGPLLGATTEIFAGACHALQMVVGLVPGAARTIEKFGDEVQQARWLPLLASGDWLSTMALTEAGAGSDLSGVRCRAERGPEGWRISGEKIFISGGDQDLTPRSLHLVLARTGAADGGVKGLSLFLAPSHDEAGVKTPIGVTRIEEKMGLHGSPTCQMLFEEAPAELLGEEGGGLAAMFTMMNHARLDVAMQGVAHAARAAHVARDYAATRKQGRAPGHQGPAPLSAHADVRRMLDEAEALAIGLRGLCHVALVELEAEEDPDLVDFLTPLCKFAGTEGGIRAANLAIQILGGYGYLREYRVEQTLRDARICAIYEGANGVHALSLATRMLRHGGGKAGEAFLRFLKQGGDEATAALWDRARARMLAAEDPSPAAQAFMELTVQAALGAVWPRIEAQAQAAPERLRALARLEAKLRPARLAFQAALLEAALDPA